MGAAGSESRAIWPKHAEEPAITCFDDVGKLDAYLNGISLDGLN